jgi:hypothetical protein
VDGIVQRDDDGKEVRFPILLTNREKDLARRVCLAFRHNVCGFDLLRTQGASYVCDVNGWSFVKKSNKYYDDVAHLLQLMMLRAVAPHRLTSAVLRHTSPPAGIMVRRADERDAAAQKEFEENVGVLFAASALVFAVVGLVSLMNIRAADKGRSAEDSSWGKAQIFPACSTTSQKVESGSGTKSRPLLNTCTE